MKHVELSRKMCMLFFVLLAISITGCSSGDENSETSESTEEEVASASAEGQPQQGGEVIVSNYFDISSYDPIKSGGDADQIFLWPVFETLVKFTPELELEPGLAESWETPDDHTVILHLREGVTFHDGTDFDAEAVKVNIERSNSDEANFSDINNIESVEVIDSLTVQLNLEVPDSTIIAALSDRGGMMVSPSALEEYGEDFSRNPVGAGPFKFVEHIPNGEIVLEAFEDYWDEGKPYSDKITIKIMADENTQVNALKSGEIDFVYGLSQENLQTIESDPNLVVSQDPSLRFDFIGLNKMEPPLDDPLVRRAILHGIDRQALINGINFGEGEQANQTYPDHYWASDPDMEIEYDPELSRALLEEAGVENVTINMAYRQMHVRFVEAIRAQLEEVGINLQIEAMELAAADANFFSERSLESYYTVYTGRVDPQQAVEALFKGDSYYNVGGVPHEEIDGLIAEAKQTYDQEERAAMYQEISRLAIHEEALQIPIIYAPRIAAMHENVKGFEPNLLGRPIFADLWIEE